jgi:hypothetical protein
MTIDLELIRSRNPIEDVVNEKFALKKSGTRYTSVEHDSLVVVPKTGFYFWNSRNESGDVFDFVGRYILSSGAWNSSDPNQFMEVVEYLAKRAGIMLEQNSDFRKPAAWAERELVKRLNVQLHHTPAALSYVIQKRGWTPETVKSARIGFMPQNKKALLANLNLSDQWISVIQRFPPGMIVYAHIHNGRLTYLSGRSIEGKKHYNPPREIIGERQPYYNHMYSSKSDQVVVVEGQADAITFGEWGIPALALGGMKMSDALLNALKEHKRVFVALDNTPDARTQSRIVAQSLGCKAYIPQLPDGAKDANEWLSKHHATADDALSMLNLSQSWLLSEASRLSELEGIEQEDAIRDLFRYAHDLDKLGIARFKEALAKVGVKGRTFNDLLKTTQPDQDSQEADEAEMSEVFSDSIPILSPALGFQNDLALVTVSLMERTRSNKLRIQPYVVTSAHELKRVADEQIIKVNNQEVALRVIPEGSEFLMRWRYTDIQRFLQGEAVEPGAVFNTVHNLFTQFVDFRSEVESRILALWAIGTYFYTMFPAYPYLALNGPKNSGKSTVLRILQPVAFNMVTTSDPTGPAMFRLIHYTSCTVGIDEAERYHNPKDMGMQQIRQLLNSGYKQGMPAIRLMGEDMKPQAFDVYSPKILAAIAGLEDILASRCIAIPMRRTDKKMPLISPQFDGSQIRHQLYTLSLTCFQHVYRNYFERPELHKLHNRSGELWSPLVALAAFFEEKGGVEGLLDAISEAGSWDEEISEGKALSDREEAVLQALELLTREEDTITLVRAVDLRRLVARLLEEPLEKLGNPQWIGHILTRLHLLDEQRRRRDNSGISYLINPNEVRDMMRRYDVRIINSTS